MTAEQRRFQIFICYAHSDRSWLERVKVHLSPLEREHDIVVWEDTRTAPGSKWREEIKDAIGRTDVAILIVSADFLASDFIRMNELPPLLRAAQEGGMIVLPIIVKPSFINYIPDLAQFQAVNYLSEPLVSMSEGQREEVLVKVAETIFFSANTRRQKEVELTSSTATRQELFLRNPDWLRLVKIGNWILDGDHEKILGSGMDTYLLSREEYGRHPFTIETSVAFSNFRQHLHHPVNKMNAGIILGWNSDDSNPRYYNILLSGQRLVLERTGLRGKDDRHEFRHLSDETALCIEEDVAYHFTANVTEKTISVLVNGIPHLTVERPPGIVGRVGLRPWRSQMTCSRFLVSENATL